MGKIYRNSFEEEILIQNKRIIVDGGVIIDSWYANQTVKLLKQLGIWSNVKFLGDANMGVKKDAANAVSKLYDLSGNNNDAVQATGANQPIWTAGVQNGKYGIVFDGTNDDLKSAMAAVALPTETFMVAKKITQSNDAYFVMGGAFGIIGHKTANTDVLVFRGTEQTAIIPAVGAVFSLRVLWNGASSEAQVNGGSVSSINPGTATYATMTIACHTNEAASFSNSGICHLSGCNIALTTSQRTAIEAFLNAYYSIY